jgi:Holliday junction DNA helicase RuvA
VIASLDGVVGAVALDSLVVEVGGVGYRVFAAPSVLVSAAPGSRIKLFTHHVVREDAQQLFGFRTVEELGFFGLLLTVTGVGPKVAMAIAGSRPTAELQLAIMQQDMAMLVAIPGIGKKLAERVIFELKEKVAAAGLAAGVAAGGAPLSGVPGGTEDEVVGALQALGYSLAEAREAARMAMRSTEAGVSLEERIKGALRLLARD